MKCGANWRIQVYRIPTVNEAGLIPGETVVHGLMIDTLADLTIRLGEHCILFNSVSSMAVYLWRCWAV